MGRLKNFNRDDVLDEAIQLFWKKGYSDTSLSDLEKATGVNKSGLYSEFKDKDDIFLESLKRYQNKNPVFDILRSSPPGLNNIKSMVQANMTCKGQKGCYLSNTIREYSIIPQKVKVLIEQNSQIMHDLVLENVKAAGIKNPEVMTSMILTFMTGISLKLNAYKPEALQKEIDGFISLISS
jgi:AcrR family transcriptional regulator